MQLRLQYERCCQLALTQGTVRSTAVSWFKTWDPSMVHGACLHTPVLQKSGYAARTQHDTPFTIVLAVVVKYSSSLVALTGCLVSQPNFCNGVGPAFKPQ